MPKPRSSASGRRRQDPRREARIINEIVVDAYNESERALAWYYHLENQLQFPFEATCKTRRTTSPLKVGQAVTITGLAPEEDCEADIIVLARWNDRPLGVPLKQLEPRRVDAGTAEAIADWHYWCSMGYRF
jgi:hypothetical protein